MVGLIDIAPKIETVDVQGASVSVHGISAKGVAHLLGRFPELRMLMTRQDVETGQLMAMGLQAKGAQWLLISLAGLAGLAAKLMSFSGGLPK